MVSCWDRKDFVPSSMWTKRMRRFWKMQWSREACREICPEFRGLESSIAITFHTSMEFGFWGPIQGRRNPIFRDVILCCQRYGCVWTIWGKLQIWWFVIMIYIPCQNAISHFQAQPYSLMPVQHPGGGSKPLQPGTQHEHHEVTIRYP